MNTKESDINTLAIEWFVLMRDNAISESDVAAFHSWLNEDPEHLSVYEDIEQIWVDLEKNRAHFTTQYPDLLAYTGPYH